VALTHATYSIGWRNFCGLLANKLGHWQTQLLPFFFRGWWIVRFRFLFYLEIKGTRNEVQKGIKTIRRNKEREKKNMYEVARKK
jgi:hypothetical protein